MLRGIGIAEGIVIATALVKAETKIEIVEKNIDDVDAEVDRLTDAVYKYTNQLEKTYKKTLNVLGEEEAAIHKNHLTILRDSVMIGGVKKQIRDKGINAECILDEVKRKYETIYIRMDDDFLRKKAEYIKNITEGIIRQLEETDTIAFDDVHSPCILVGKSLDAADTIDLDKQYIQGILLEDRNKTSHGAALAKNWKIPCILGVKNLSERIVTGDQLIIDGKKGEITVNPDKSTLQYFKDKLNRERELDEIYSTYIGKETVTKDHYKLSLDGIVSKPDEVLFAFENGADQIGLFRTEVLFVGREVQPDEEEQFQTYKEAVRYAKGNEICFRTFDCNGKSDLPYIHLPEENNPALGFFSTRIALANRDILLTQVKAILRAGVTGNVRFVIPMVSSIDELLDIQLLIEDAKLILEEEGKLFNRNMKYGIVLETPSVAIITPFFAQDVDFIQVDVDDMLQYVTGTDPTNEMVFELYDEFHPGFLRILRSIIRLSHREGTGICFSGSLCTHELLVPIFLAMGVDQLIVPYKEIPRVRWEINNSIKKDWDTILEEVAKMPSGKSIKHHLEKKYGEAFLWKQKSESIKS